MSLLTGLQYYWDLSSAAGTTITDQHNGLVLTKAGTVTTSATGGPDGGACIDVGAALGKYRNASVAKLAAYDTNFTTNIWARSTGTSSTGNWVFNHRDAGTDPQYWQEVARRTGGASANNDFVVIRASSTSHVAESTQEALNTWQMITGVRRGSNVEFWRNGTLLDTTAITGTVDTGAAGFAIGGDSWAASVSTALNHRGQLAMAGMWNKALLGSQITALYNGGDGLRYADLTHQTRRRRDLGGYGL